MICCRDQNLENITQNFVAKGILKLRSVSYSETHDSRTEAEIHHLYPIYKVLVSDAPLLPVVPST